MVTYDLKCVQGHIFEAWFKDHQTFLDQKAADGVDCPTCGSKGVDIAFTGCSVRTERRAEPPAAVDSLFEKLTTYLEKNYENVGREFAEEARRIHYKEAESRNIRGQTTPEEEKELREEGIDFIKLPLPKLDS